MAKSDINEVQDILGRMAKRVGDVYGVAISVGRSGSDLVFVDGGGDQVVDEALPTPEPVLCAAADEIKDGSFLKLFAGRAMYAALVERYNQLERE